MKQFTITAIALSVFSLSVTAAPTGVPSSGLTTGHYANAVENFQGTIVGQEAFDDITKYIKFSTKPEHQAAYKSLKEAFDKNGGKLTAQDIKDSGIDAHHFYTGYLASSTTQAQYDARLKELNGGHNADNNVVTNRELKANGSMIMNQVETGNNLQNKRVDKVVEGLNQLGEHVANNTGTGGEGESNQEQVDKNTSDITTNSNSIEAIGTAFSDRVNTVNGYLEQVGTAIKNTSNAGLTDRMDTLEGAFAAQAEQTAQEIGRLDGRIDQLEEKTDKMKAGIASATAIASLTQYTGNGTHHIAVGVGAYDGAAALAAGYTYAFDKQTTVRATLALDSEKEATIGASVGHSW